MLLGACGLLGHIPESIAHASQQRILDDRLAMSRRKARISYLTGAVLLARMAVAGFSEEYSD